jgi:hypothetical protein
MDHFRFGLRLTVTFFLLGTVILILFATTLSPQVALFAYQFTITAILIHWLYAAILLFYLLKRTISLPALFKTFGVMMINIPVGLLYAWLMAFFVGFTRLTLINNTDKDIPVIQIEGCGQKIVHNLEKNESKTIWIEIPAPCKVSIRYEGMSDENKADSLFLEGGRKMDYTLPSGNP